ncbi:LINE-1 type transposase domain containing protein 1 [Dissostichus eleginoides]|uniref:LINE-1 type transposase domain containing protein 1 n=1 Tax=Dissostichus eleginoides TaxID=100907 RepID=A0AAD9FEA4_DISEL|nr:LINE-1 type transposase domain containing protein 1 [Dissostichus eleginoides]
MATSMAALESKVTELRWDVSSNSTRINKAEGRIHHAEKTLEKTEAALDSANKRIAYLESKMDDLEHRGRRKNLRLFGIREGAEGQQTLFHYVNDMLTRWLELTPHRAFTLEPVHRTLASGKPNQHRAVIVRFLKFQDMEFVYHESRRRHITHDGGKISYAGFTCRTVRIRRGFNSVTKLFVDINAFRGFQHNPGKLRVQRNGNIYLFTTPQEAETFYKSIQQ